MRDVAIIGVGCTKFGELWNKSFRALGIEAGMKAMEDANLSGSEVDGIFIGNMSAGRFINQQHIDALIADYSGMATHHIPATRVEAGGASGGVAFRQAVMAVASGMNDVVLVGGAEKMTDLDDASINSVMDATADADWEAGMGVTFASLHAMIAQRMIHDGIATREEIASFAVNSHFHGALNPNAQFRKAVPIETVLKSGPVATPLGMFDCAPISDGAASLVLCPLEDAKKYTDSYVKVSAVTQASDTLALAQRPDITSYGATVAAAERAYKQVGITAADISVAEVHDVYTVAGIMALQDLGFYKRGEAGKAVLEGQCQLGGSGVTINTSGGLKARGHPIGATGVAQVAEIVEQLRGSADKRQVENAKYGLAQSSGGMGSAVTVSIMEAI
ncbi:MAG: thiolase domain-containing protein [Candidatus Methanomethylophilaceae archaeon]|nr:thiolase domain-containing protein [Candidatus Methanomethylophilaceae archaeon]MBQ8644107.1 thiolase domain-containing protein [Candidatus Methanomethylophilaceae archaeon]MBR2348760.1 thiolase domain-containing protein [Candidatus Methanomethylophilaceae archaeon]